jgi:hypothetical protein
MSITQIRITLEKPYRIKADGTETPLSVRYGTSEARLIRQNSAVAFSGIEANADDFVDAGAFQDKLPRSIRRMQPGKAITWQLVASDELRRCINVPIEAAILWFGDWRIQQESEPGTPPEMTYGFERNRVALRWGWWKMPQVTASGRSHTSRGEEPADQTKIERPFVPRVLLQDVDERGNVGLKLNYRPWEHFEWEADVVVANPFAHVQGPAPAIETFSLAQLKQIVAKLEAEEKRPPKKVD